VHAIHELICGIRGAEDGTVDIYARGTSTRATLYSSYEGDGATTPTSATTLDANGGGEFYVNETCDVVVRDSGGVEVRRFTSASAASAVEVISQSFTGTDYDSGTQAASKPLALSTVLDALYTSFGARDFNVLFGGASTSMQVALAGVGSLFFNVKSPAYGAVGDAVANDTAAIQAAIDAANTAGGGVVFFPKGTYRVTALITVKAGVSLLGAGASASVIRSTSASADILVFAADLTQFTTMSGLKVTFLASSSGKIVNAEAGRLLRIENCSLGPAAFANTTTCITYDVAGTVILVLNVLFSNLIDTGKAVSAATTTAASIAHIWGCKVTFLAGVYNNGPIFDLSCGTVLGTTVDCAGMAATSVSVASFGAVSGGLVQAFAFNTVTNPSSGTVTAPTGIVSATANYDQFAEFGNRLGSSIATVAPGGAASKATYFGQHTLHRDRGRYYALSNDASVSGDAGKYAVIEIERTDTAAQNFGFTAAPGPGAMDCVLIYNNLNQGSVTGTITINAASMKGLTSFTVNANKFSAYFFRSVHVDTNSYWLLVGSLVNQS
jgi:hypothetical protein